MGHNKDFYQSVPCPFKFRAANRPWSVKKTYMDDLESTRIKQKNWEHLHLPRGVGHRKSFDSFVHQVLVYIYQLRKRKNIWSWLFPFLCHPKVLTLYLEHTLFLSLSWGFLFLFFYFHLFYFKLIRARNIDPTDVGSNFSTSGERKA